MILLIYFVVPNNGLLLSFTKLLYNKFMCNDLTCDMLTSKHIMSERFYQILINFAKVNIRM